MWNGRYNGGASRKQFVNWVDFWLCNALWIPLYKWGVLKKTLRNFQKACTFCAFSVATNWGDIFDVNLVYQVRFQTTYRALKVAGNYRPGRRKMGFALWFSGAMPSGFSYKQLMLAESPSLWASTAFVITTALGLLLCLSLLASIGFVMTNPFAWVSVTLSKHCFWLSKCARCVSATLSKHCFWTPKINLPQCLSVLASIGFG